MKILAGVAFAALIGFSGAASALTLVSASDSGTTDLGSFAAGTYHITATGLVDLAGPVGSGFDIDADGVPQNGSVAAQYLPEYAGFNPSGTYIADGLYGPGGTVTKFGGLMGSFTKVDPLGNFGAVQSVYFNIGSSDIVHLASMGHIYAQVNDTYYTNDEGAFSVTVTAVPEPATWAMFLLGFGAIGWTLRSRRNAAAATA